MVGDLVEACAEDLDDLPGEPGAQFSFLEPCLGFGEGVVRAAEVSEEASGREAQEVSRGQGRAKGEPFGCGIYLVAEAEVEGRGNGFRGRGRARGHGVRGPFRGARGVLRGEDRLRCSGPPGVGGL